MAFEGLTAVQLSEMKSNIASIALPVFESVLEKILTHFNTSIKVGIEMKVKITPEDNDGVHVNIEPILSFEEPQFSDYIILTEQHLIRTAFEQAVVSLF